MHTEGSVGHLLCRIAILTTENKTLKQQLQTVLDKGHHDNELIEALLVCFFVFAHSHLDFRVVQLTLLPLIIFRFVEI